MALKISWLEVRLRTQPGLANLSILSIAWATASGWYAISRQFFAAVAGTKLAERIDTFNGNYGKNQSLVAQLLKQLALLPTKASVGWRTVDGVTIGAGLVLF